MPLKHNLVNSPLDIICFKNCLIVTLYLIKRDHKDVPYHPDNFR